jgi:HEAT repeat protein
MQPPPLAQVRLVATEAIPALTASLKDQNGYVSLPAAVSLSRIDPDSTARLVPILVALLKNEEAEVRVRAAALLENIDPAAAAKTGVR